MANEQAKNLGILVSGLIMSKNEFDSDKGPKFVFDLAIPGQKETVTIKVTREHFHQNEEMSAFKSKANFNLYKGRAYWTAEGVH